MRTIGILGGMGPEATAQVYLEIVRIFQRRYGARFDADFPPMLIASLPVPDVVQRVENEPRFVEMLCRGARRLERAGADVLLIACNTAQKYVRNVLDATHLPCVDLVEEVADNLTWRGYRRAGLLGTEATLQQGLYAKACTDRGLELLTPEPADRVAVTRIILEVLRGTRPGTLRAPLLEIVDRLQSRGAEAVILGCTELPLVIQPGDAPLELVDTIRVLAEAAVREARATPTVELGAIDPLVSAP